jgi:peptidoglycan/LPS O-acetylase OafA/YrhL
MKTKRARVWSAVVLGFFLLLALLSIGHLPTSNEPYTFGDAMGTIGILAVCWVLGFFSGKETEKEKGAKK